MSHPIKGKGLNNSGLLKLFLSDGADNNVVGLVFFLTLT